MNDIQFLIALLTVVGSVVGTILTLRSQDKRELGKIKVEVERDLWERVDKDAEKRDAKIEALEQAVLVLKNENNNLRTANISLRASMIELQKTVDALEEQLKTERGERVRLEKENERLRLGRSGKNL